MSTQTPIEVLLDYKNRLNELKTLRDHLNSELKRLGVSGQDYTEWSGSCEKYAISNIVKAIQGNHALPVDEKKIAAIPNENGIRYGTGYGRWLECTKPEYLQNWIDKNIGDNPIKTEIQNVLQIMFPPYLRDKDHVLDDKKRTVSRHVTDLELKYNNTYELSYQFDPKPYEKFLQLCHSIGGNIPYEEAGVPAPTLFSRENAWSSPELYTWHEISNSEGVTRIRPLKGGTWRFQLTDNAYNKIKELAQKNFDQKTNKKV